MVTQMDEFGQRGVHWAATVLMLITRFTAGIAPAIAPVSGYRLVGIRYEGEV